MKYFGVLLLVGHLEREQKQNSHVCKKRCMHACVHVRMPESVYVCIYVRTSPKANTVSMYTCIFHIYIYMYIYIYLYFCNTSYSTTSTP